MKDLSDMLDLKHNRFLRLGLSFVATAVVVSLSALFYAKAVFQKTLNVGSTTGVTSGVGSSSTPGIDISLIMILILVLQAFVASLSVLGFPPKLPKRVKKLTSREASTSNTPKPGEKEEWEESASEESVIKNQDVVGDILESLRKKSAAGGS